MSYVKVKQKYQITIPVVIRKKLKLHEGDMLEIKEQEGVLVLVPQTLSNKQARIDEDNNTSTLFSMLGANAESGLYSSSESIDTYISELRDEWN